MILTCEGEVFFATHSIESYLGFHQVSLAEQNDSNINSSEIYEVKRLSDRPNQSNDDNNALSHEKYHELLVRFQQ